MGALAWLDKEDGSFLRLVAEVHQHTWEAQQLPFIAVHKLYASVIGSDEIDQCEEENALQQRNTTTARPLSTPLSKWARRARKPQ